VRYLLDTHTFFWAVSDVTQLTSKVLTALSDPKAEVFVSSASAWEMSIKHRSGRFPEAALILPDFYKTLAKARFLELMISSEHGIAAGDLAWIHKDPFDRVLVAQAQLEHLILVTSDSIMMQSDLVQILW
jgi:PIN domain nuclease of toxin-antitoxin system